MGGGGGGGDVGDGGKWGGCRQSLSTKGRDEEKEIGAREGELNDIANTLSTP